MASSPPASSPNAPQTPTNDAQSSHAAGATRERSNSSVPLAKRFKLDHAEASATPGASNSTNASINGAKPATTAAAAAAAAAAAPEQRDNFDSLVDVMGASGVDLQAEEEAIQRREQLMQQSRTAQHRGAQPDDDEVFLQIYPLAYKVHTLAQQHGLSVDAAVLNYLSLAARTRLKNMLEAMIASSRHRSWSSHHHAPPLYASTSQPMYDEQILTDPAKQLAALEKAERGDEARRRRERLARDEESSAAAAGLDADMDLDDGTTKADGRKRPKKMGPGVAARNMSEDVRKRLADSTAMRNLGGGSSKYSWLSGASSFPGSFSPLGAKKSKPDADDAKSASRLPKPKFAPQPAVSNWSGGGASDAGAATSSNASTGAWGDVTARQAAKDQEERQARLKVTLRDALFALEYERRAGAGHGSGEALLYRIRAGDDHFLKAKEAQ